MARELGYPRGQVAATTGLVIGAIHGGDPEEAARLARQSAQIPGIPGTAYRVRSYLLASALTEAGDLAGAEHACAATLAQARDAADLNILGELLWVMADLGLRTGRTGDAAAHLREAAQLALPAGAWLTILNVLECCGHLCAATGRFADVITAWAVCDTHSPPGSGNADADTRRREGPFRDARRALGPDRAQAAEQRGKAMSLTAAAEYALLLTAPAPPPEPAGPGTARLTARERQLVTLVAQGRTDTQIADQLYISIRTVRSHLDRIRDKTGSRRRADLTRLALAEGLV
jgi:DNA-binding CsgD family transcriptional regulator